MKIKDRVFEVMVDVFQVSPEKITDTTAPGVLEEWDSLKHMLLLLALEEEFEVRFTDDEMAECDSAAKIVEVLNKKGSD